MKILKAKKKKKIANFQSTYENMFRSLLKLIYKNKLKKKKNIFQYLH